MASAAHWWRSSGWWSFGFPVVGMIGWGGGTALIQVGLAAWSDPAGYARRDFAAIMFAMLLSSAFIGLFFMVAVSAGTGLAVEFAKNVEPVKRGALAVLCALAFLVPGELFVFFYGLPMGDGPVNNFGLDFSLRLPWASPYAHAAIVGVGAWFAHRARSVAKAV